MALDTYNVPPGDDRVTIVCLYCNKPQEVARKAMTITCRFCNKSLKLEDMRFTAYQARRTIDTCGVVTIEKKGHVIADNIHCGGLIVRGKVKGDILSRGPVLVGPEAEVRGDVIAPSVAIGAGAVLEGLPERSVDMVMTSPPYWSVRRYAGGDGLGNEGTPQEYVERLVGILSRLEQELKLEGSLWLNLGDTYVDKGLCGIPWQVALGLQRRGWMIRNAVVWDKVKGNPCNSRDKLRDMYELVFHLVRGRRFYYDVDAIRQTPRPASVREGRVTTATGVSGVRYRRQIAGSQLTDNEKDKALRALDGVLGKVARGELSDFRMLVRGVQRATHGEDAEFSGRAGELDRNGFCILPYHPKGAKPGDVWRVVPEDEWRKDGHAAVFPVELCRVPILATCPPEGIVLDPFVGTGTTVAAAIGWGRRGVGIDVSEEYLAVAERRIEAVLTGKIRDGGG